MSNLLKLGWSGEYCYPPYQKYGPGIRDCNIIHYVISGSGTLKVGGKAYEVSAGRAFIIYAGERIEYYADRHDPWHYVWIDFSGEACEELLSKTGFTRDVRVSAPLDSSILLPIFKSLSENGVGDYNSLVGASDFLRLIAEIAKSFPKALEFENPGSLASRAKAMIKSNYKSLECRVEKVADILGVSRSQLYRSFKEKYGVSPKTYIDGLRMEYAEKMLEETELSIAEVSYSSGFSDPLYFSSVFRRFKGTSPTEYKRLKTKEGKS